jgi:hypothetical protein
MSDAQIAEIRRADGRFLAVGRNNNQQTKKQTTTTTTTTTPSFARTIVNDIQTFQPSFISLNRKQHNVNNARGRTFREILLCRLLRITVALDCALTELSFQEEAGKRQSNNSFGIGR